MTALRLRVTRSRRNRRAIALRGVVPAVVGLIFLVVPLLQLLTPYLMIWAVVGVVLAYRGNLSPHLDEAELVVGDVTFGTDGDVVPLSAIRSASWRRDVRYGPLVEVLLEWPRSRTYIVEDDDGARALVEALGADPARRSATFRALSRADAAPWFVRGAILFLPLVLFPALIWLQGRLAGELLPDSWSPPVLTLIAWSLALVAFVPSRVEVGSDGISLQWLIWRRFVPLSAVAEVSLLELRSRGLIGIELTLRDGSRLPIAVERGREVAIETPRLLERIRDALSLRRGEGGGAVAATLARRGRDAGVWLASLRARGSGADADHRTSTPSTERLWDLLHDGGAAPSARAAAAVVLASSPGEDRARIRIAARSAASTSLRIALERAASADVNEEHLAETLAALDLADGPGSTSAGR